MATALRIGPDFSFETKALATCPGPVAGIDEAGRGPWAGPVAVAAVILDGDALPDGLDDSKKLTEARREALYDDIHRSALSVSVMLADVQRIDRDNILAATMWAMAQAVERLDVAPAYALVDGNRAPDLDCPHETIVKGDGRSLSIAAASIIAKVTRDRLMCDLAAEFGAYGWQRNKGYGTAEHAAALRAHGVTIHHRRSFKPVAELLAEL